MRRLLPAFLYFLFLPFLIFCQKNTTQWQAAFEQPKVFIENKSQFNGLDDRSAPVLYSTQTGNTMFLFNKHGVSYRLEKLKMREEDENEMMRHDVNILGAKPAGDKDRDREKEREKKEEEVTGIALVHMQWEGANDNVEVIATEAVNDYYNYQGATKSIDRARAYKKLIYRNLYPHIDVEYVFHKDKGIEYSLILHPGADISQVKMRYSGTEKISLNLKGEIHIPTMFGDIVDHAPTTYYSGNATAKISSAFVKDGKEISFKLGEYDHSKTVIIDPWTVTPSMPHSNRVFYIKADSSGNAYIYGGDSYFNLQKYNSSGVRQWTYLATWDSSSTWFGTLEVDRAGNSYITGGSEAGISKVDPTGTEIWLKNPTALLIEYWALTFNCDQTKLVAGGTLNFKGTAFAIDLATGNYSTTFTAANTLGINPNEIRTLCSSPSGNYYALTLDSIVSISPSLTLNYRHSSTYVFAYGSPSYGLGTPQGQSAIRASASYIYTMNGSKLSQRDIATGNIITTVTIPGGVTQTILGQMSPGNGGIDLDSCGNVYVGSTTGVYKYDANLNFISSATTPSAVFDVTVSTNGIVFACGQAYAMAINMSACPQVKTICYTTPLSAQLAQTPPACFGQCTGTATATPVNGTGPFSYKWNNSATTQTINNLCAGTYIVTITDQSNNDTATASVVVSQPSAISPSASAVAASCGNSNGSASVTVTGGNAPYTYLWSNNSTSATISNLASGSYTVTVTGTGNCTATASVSVSTTAGLTLTPGATATTCGNSNGSATVNATGGTGTYTYVWSNNGTGQTISNVAPGTYNVTVTGGGCSATASASVASSTGLSANATSTAAGCTADGTASVNVTGGTGSYTYLWSNNATTQSLNSLSAGTYTVTVTGSGCSATASTTVTSSGGGFSLTPASTPASCGANTGTATATPSGTGPYTYAWSNNGTTQTISNLASGTYTVTVTSGGCSATASINVTVSGGLTVNPVPTATTCGNNNGSAIANATGGTGTYTYNWSNNASTQTISNVAPGTYTVTVTGAGGCSGTASVNIAASTGITLTPSSVNTTCGNNNGSASVAVTGGTGNYTYTWSNNSSAATVVNLAAGTYQVTVHDASGCSSTASVTINPSGGNSVVVGPSSIICAGDSATVCAPAGYVSYAWNTGDTTTCITTPYAGNYYVTVTDNGGCTATSNHASINNYTPTPVTISVNGDTLTSYTAVTYQWYLNGQPIPGATTATIVAHTSGNYTVEITDNNGCHYTSSVTTIKVTGLDNVSAGSSIKVYPNPLAAGNWHVDVSEALIGATCQVFDADGRLVYKDELKSTQSEISLNVAQGVYLMQIYSPHINYNLKLIKLY
jgi:SprB repeat